MGGVVLNLKGPLEIHGHILSGAVRASCPGLRASIPPRSPCLEKDGKEQQLWMKMLLSLVAALGTGSEEADVRMEK